MKRCWLLTCSNFRKAKGQAITIFVLVLLAAMLLNIWLILSFQYSKNFDARSELLNSEDVLFIYQSQDPAFINPLQTVLAEDARTDMYTIENCLSLNLTCKYRDGDMNTYFVCYPAGQAAERSLGQYRFLEKTENPAENTIYLPYLYQTGGGYQTGDPFEFSVQNTTYRFIVGGFFENMLAGSFNGGVCTMLMEQSAYDALAEEQSLASTSVSVKLKEKADNAAYASQTGDKILQLYPQIGYNYTWYDMSKQARTMTANICSAIVSGVAFLIIIIALIVIAFNVSNGIDEGMQSLGALKAIGYKSRQLILSLLLQFLLAGCGGVLCGAALSYAVLPILNALLVAQTGIPWEVRFFGIPMALSLLMILLMIAAAVYLSARKIRKIAPIDMLRQGIRTHNFKRNPFPL